VHFANGFLFPPLLSFINLNSIRSNEKDTRLVNILKQRTDNVSIKQHAVTYMQETVCAFRDLTSPANYRIWDDVGLIRVHTWGANKANDRGNE
jgi:hypothetical protein